MSDIAPALLATCPPVAAAAAAAAAATPGTDPEERLRRAMWCVPWTQCSGAPCTQPGTLSTAGHRSGGAPAQRHAALSRSNLNLRCLCLPLESLCNVLTDPLERLLATSQPCSSNASMFMKYVVFFARPLQHARHGCTGVCIRAAACLTARDSCWRLALSSRQKHCSDLQALCDSAGCSRVASTSARL